MPFTILPETEDLEAGIDTVAERMVAAPPAFLELIDAPHVDPSVALVIWVVTSMTVDAVTTIALLEVMAP